MITIIPAIDILNGHCVRLSQGKYDTAQTYFTSPLDVARQYEDCGVRRIHLVDLDGAKKRQVVNWKILESIARNTSLCIDFGGGIQSDDDIEKVFSSGAKQITAGSISIKNPDLVRTWIKRFGAERIIIGADVRDLNISIHGWQETTPSTVDELISDFDPSGIQTVICTDISRDGTLSEPNYELYSHLKELFPHLFIIASGGIANKDQIHELNRRAIDGVIVGKALYEKTITLKELQQLL